MRLPCLSVTTTSMFTTRTSMTSENTAGRSSCWAGRGPAAARAAARRVAAARIRGRWSGRRGLVMLSCSCLGRVAEGSGEYRMLEGVGGGGGAGLRPARVSGRLRRLADRKVRAPRERHRRGELLYMRTTWRHYGVRTAVCGAGRRPARVSGRLRRLADRKVRLGRSGEAAQPRKTPAGRRPATFRRCGRSPRRTAAGQRTATFLHPPRDDPYLRATSPFDVNTVPVNGS